MRKLMWFAIGFAIAAVIGMYLLWENLYFFASGMAAILLGVSLLLLRRFPKLRCTAVLLLGLVLGFLWMFGYDSLYLSTARAADGEKLRLTLTATDYSETSDYDGVRVEGYGILNNKPYKMIIYLPKAVSVSPGDTITGRFDLRCSLPGCAHEIEYNRADGVFLTAIGGAALTIQQAESLPWYCYPAVIRNEITSVIDKTFSPECAAFAKALLVGETDDISYETDTAFKISGVRHIIAVSGLHVTILFSLVYFVTGRKRLLTTLLGLPMMLFFAAIAGFSPSIKRACIMHALMVLALLFEKEYDSATALSFAALIMLIVNPWTVTNVGFQLSVGCMAGIICFAGKIRDWVMARKHLTSLKSWSRKIANWFASSVAMSLSAIVFTTPLCAYYFGMVSLVAPITNLLTLWIVTFVFYGVILAVLAGLLWLPLGGVLAYVTSWGINYIFLITKWIASFPLSAVYTSNPFIILWLVLCYGLLIWYLLMKKKRPLEFGCCAALMLSVALLGGWLLPQRDACRLAVLDVGQGQCIVLQSEGKTYVVDCGGYSDTMAADKAASYLLGQGISRIDGLIFTHFDADHAAGAEYLLSRISADMLYLPNCPDEDGTSEALRQREHISVAQNLQICYGDTKISLIPSQTAISDNESGLCILFQQGNCDILITGDQSTQGELNLLQQVTLPKLEVLIVGHHGSKYSTGDALLKATMPEIAIISVGADNIYGHPATEVLERLEKYDCEILRTDQMGTVIYRG